MPSYSESIQPDESFTSRFSEADSPVVIPEMLVFDNDGVITEPVTGEVELEAVNVVVKILEKG